MTDIHSIKPFLHVVCSCSAWCHKWHTSYTRRPPSFEGSRSHQLDRFCIWNWLHVKYLIPIIITAYINVIYRGVHRCTLSSLVHTCHRNVYTPHWVSLPEVYKKCTSFSRPRKITPVELCTALHLLGLMLSWTSRKVYISKYTFQKVFSTGYDPVLIPVAYCRG